MIFYATAFLPFFGQRPKGICGIAAITLVGFALRNVQAVYT